MKIASIPPRSAQQVASGGLGRTDRKAAVCAEQGFDCREFAFVAHRGRGGVGIQVLNLGCVHAGLAQCLLHGAAGAVAIFGPGGHVVRVGAGAIAHQLGDGCGAACQGMLQLFDDQQAGAFAHDETIAGLIEGARGALRGVVVIAREGACGSEASQADSVNGRLRPAAERYVDFPRANHPCSVADGLDARRTCGHRSPQWPLETMTDGDMTGGHIAEK